MPSTDRWGKGYSRAGLAALKGRDEEAAYWFYANGLKWDPGNTDLLRGRDAGIQAVIHSYYQYRP